MRIIWIPKWFGGILLLQHAEHPFGVLKPQKQQTPRLRIAEIQNCVRTMLLAQQQLAVVDYGNQHASNL